MFDTTGQIIFNNEIVAKASDFNMGIEVETIRIDSAGRLTKEPYPKALGNQRKNHFIKTDVYQIQSEIITPTARKSLDAMHYLMALNDTLRNALEPNELLWPLSMPPVLPKDKSTIPIADVDPDQKAYYEKWIKTRSDTQGIPVGVHLNVSINDGVLKTVWQAVQSQYDSYADFVNYLYIKIAQGFDYYRWLITYLFGNSPIAEKNFFKPDEDQPQREVRSIRSSNYGLTSDVTHNYRSVPDYVKNIEKNIADGNLFSEAEYHSSVRLKTMHGDLTNMVKNGTDYIELRMLDLDPTTALGVRTSAIRFFRILLSYFMMMPTLESDDKINLKLEQGRAMNEVVAMESPTQQTIYHHESQNFLDKLQMFGAQIQWGPEYQEVLDTMQDRLDNPNLTPAATLCDHEVDGSLMSYGLAMANRYQNRAHENPNPFTGFEEKPDMNANELRQRLFGVMGKPENYSKG